MIALSVFLFLFVLPSSDQKTQFEFDDIYNAEYRPKSFSPRWLPDKNEFLYTNAKGDIVQYNADHANDTIIIEASHPEFQNASAYFVSPDLKYVLVGNNKIKQWRHSFSAVYKIIDVSANTKIEFPKGQLAGKRLEYANWGTIGSKLSFVFENNLYIQDSPNSEPVPVTKDGSKTTYNGVPNWLYEEDVISSRVTHYWSPKNTHICWAKINDDEVPTQSWPLYGSKENTYEQLRTINYPKAGLVNGTISPTSKVSLQCCNSKNNSTLIVLAGIEKDNYYLQVAWKDDDNVFVTWTNREQNVAYNVLYKLTETTSTINPIVIYSKKQTGGWIEVVPEKPLFIEEGKRFITIEPHEITVGGRKSVWRHPVVFQSEPSSEEVYLLNKEEEVEQLLGYDETTKTLYYITTWGISTERHIASVKVISNNTESLPDAVCLTKDSWGVCRYISSSFSSSTEFYFHNCLGPGYPTYTLKKTKTGGVERVFEDNAALNTSMKSKYTPAKNYYTFKSKHGHQINIELYSPAAKQKGEQFKLLVYTYAGPGTQEVSKRIDFGSTTKNWLLHLVSQYRIAIASIDGRGTLGNGEDLKFQIYKNLGVVEVEDQIAGAQYLKDNVDFIYKEKPFLIFGWSYGGHTAAHVLGHNETNFKCAISVAPVTNKAYYDTAYSERYLGLVTENEGKAYKNTDVMEKVKNFKDKQFFVAHGMADDNVHYSNFAHLVRELEKNEIMFTQMTYPDEDHSISTTELSRHLFKSMTKFVMDCYNGSSQTGSNLTVLLLGLIFYFYLF